MPIITTSGLGDSVRAQYEAQYVEGAVFKKLYDQFSSPVPGGDMQNMKRGSSVVIPFLSKLAPSTQTMSETSDLTPRTLSDTTVSITPTSRGNAVKVSEKVDLTVYTDWAGKLVQRIGENMEESLDLYCKSIALAGSLVKRTVARASLDAGTTTHRMSRTVFSTAEAMLTGLKAPGFETPSGEKWMALMHPWALVDLTADATLVALGEYQQGEIVLNGELGSLNHIKIVTNPFAHVFYGAGVANATNIATTLAADIDEGATSFDVASGTSIAVGQRMLIGTKESSSTLYETNESVIVKSISTNTVGIVGEGPNGGTRFAHASGEAFTNTDNVIPVLFGGPESLAKIFDTEIGEFGQVVGPKKEGLADQWTTLAWKWYGAYAIPAENRILRWEVSTSLDA